MVCASKLHQQRVCHKPGSGERRAVISLSLFGLPICRFAEEIDSLLLKDHHAIDYLPILRSADSVQYYNLTLNSHSSSRRARRLAEITPAIEPWTQLHWYAWSSFAPCQNYTTRQVYVLIIQYYSCAVT